MTTIFKPGDSRKVSNAFDKYRAELTGVEMGKWSWNPNNIVETITDRGVADLEYNSLAMYAFARDKGLIEPQTGESNDVSEIVRQATKSRTDEVAPWFQSKLSDIGVTPEEKIFDGFTNMGNRRYLKHD
ncbi:hypothetical protein RXO91_29860, partial [Pseudomonas aeruginosa]|nr:hypothetical protein [Pseudomonas aeruginosa]